MYRNTFSDPVFLAGLRAVRRRAALRRVRAAANIRMTLPRCLVAALAVLLLAAAVAGGAPAPDADAANLALRAAHERQQRKRREHLEDMARWSDRRDDQRRRLDDGEPPEEEDPVGRQMREQNERRIAAAAADGRGRLGVHLAQHGITVAPPPAAPALSHVEAALWCVVVCGPLLWAAQLAAAHFTRARSVSHRPVVRR
jgi:hypothetical protein